MTEPVKISIREYWSIDPEGDGWMRGHEARKKLHLDNKDCDTKTYMFLLPDDAESVCSSFFCGMFAESIYFLGEMGFMDKYLFCHENGGDLSPRMEHDINDGIYNAVYEMEV